MADPRLTLLAKKRDAIVGLRSSWGSPKLRRNKLDHVLVIGTDVIPLDPARWA